MIIRHMSIFGIAKSKNHITLRLQSEFTVMYPTRNNIPKEKEIIFQSK